MEDRKAYLDKIKAQIKIWEGDIQKLEGRSEKARINLQSAYKEQISELRTRTENMRKKMNELSESTDDAWGELKKGLEKSWKELSKAFKKAQSKY